MRLTVHSTLATLGVLAVLSTFGAFPLEAQEAPVEVTLARTAEIPKRIELSASVVSPRSAKISTDIGGLVRSVIVDLGDRVKARSMGSESFELSWPPSHARVSAGRPAGILTGSSVVLSTVRHIFTM